jgi:predicted nucleotidyltransferase
VSSPAFEPLLRLADANVGFVLVGGLAVNAWGVVRGTRDLDIVADPAPENLNRLATLAASEGGHVHAREAFASSPFAIAALLAGGERVEIETALGALDVVQGLPGVPSYEELRSRAVEVEIAGVKVAVCALEDLRSMKRAAGRARDLADLEDLDAAHRHD